MCCLYFHKRRADFTKTSRNNSWKWRNNPQEMLRNTACLPLRNTRSPTWRYFTKCCFESPLYCYHSKICVDALTEKFRSSRLCQMCENSPGRRLTLQVHLHVSCCPYSYRQGPRSSRVSKRRSIISHNLARNTLTTKQPRTKEPDSFFLQTATTALLTSQLSISQTSSSNSSVTNIWYFTQILVIDTTNVESATNHTYVKS